MKKTLIGCFALTIIFIMQAVYGESFFKVVAISNAASQSSVTIEQSNQPAVTTQLVATNAVSVTLVSYDHQGQQIIDTRTLGSGIDWGPSISGNGQVIAFPARLINIDNPRSTTGTNIFVHDRSTGKTELISKTSAGTPSQGLSREPSLSFDGRYVAFYSQASDLDAPNDPNGLTPNVLVYDRLNQAYVLAIRGHAPRLSASGRFLAVHSHPLVGNDIYDLNQVTEPVEFIPNVLNPFISANGRYLTYFSLWDVYLYDRNSGTTEIISVNDAGEPGDPGNPSQLATVSSDGNYAAFKSWSNRLVENDHNDQPDIFLRIRDEEKTIRISTAPDGSELISRFDNPTISANGRYVIFEGGINGLVDPDPQPDNGPFYIYGHVYIYDHFTSKIERVSLKADGQIGPYGFLGTNNDGTSPISADGCTVAFVSNGLVSYDQTPVGDDVFGSGFDIYVRDLCASAPKGYDINGKIVDLNGDPMAGVGISLGPQTQTVTDEQGEYDLTGIVAGTYTLTANADYTIIPPTLTVTVPPDSNNLDFVACYSDKLARRFAPLMFFNEKEKYLPIAVETPLQHSQLVTYETIGGIPYERRVIVDSPSIVDLLEHNTNDTYIDFEGDGNDGMLNAYKQFNASTRLATYARIYCPITPHPDYPEITTVIQYWFFYYDNPWLNRHEGDWEMIEVLLDRNFLPQYGGYSQHFKGQRRPWSDMRKIGTQPFVYVSQDGHGSYFRDSWWSYGGFDDSTTNMQEGLKIPIEMIPITKDEDSWLYFNGHWGSRGLLANPFDNGPLGPKGRIAEHLVGKPSLWDEPIEWFAKLDPYKSASENIVGKINVAAPPPIKILIKVITDQPENRSTREQIPDIEYITDTETLQNVAIFHNPEPSRMYQVEFTAKEAITNTAASQKITIHFPDFASNKMSEAHYILPIEWNTQSSAFVVLPFDNKRGISVDLDGDGNLDQEILPTEYLESPLTNRILLPLIMK